MRNTWVRPEDSTTYSTHLTLETLPFYTVVVLLLLLLCMYFDYSFDRILVITLIVTLTVVSSIALFTHLPQNLFQKETAIVPKEVSIPRHTINTIIFHDQEKAL